jgi:S-DNA-T family DNA segregation ATPase FtsK/SpoIIIE
MLRSGWDAHNLNAPGMFLVSTPEHDTPKRARAYLVTDQAVTETAALYTDTRPELDEVSRRALTTVNVSQNARRDRGSGDISEDEAIAADRSTTPGDVLWRALSLAPEEGTEIAELMRITGTKRTKLYRHLREHAEAGRAIQVSRGHWRAHHR